MMRSLWADFVTLVESYEKTSTNSGDAISEIADHDTLCCEVVKQMMSV